MARRGRYGLGRSVRFWPSSAGPLRGPAAFLLGLLAVAGCGGATAPCPTPTTELDRLRDESERLEEELSRAEGERAELDAEREAAADRVAAGQAALDSLARARAR